MTSSDVRDVLNLPDGLSGPRPAKKARPSLPKPNLKGLAREVHQLGGDNPIAIVPQTPYIKKRRPVSRKPAEHWELRPFRNSARQDQTLVLRHWRRCEAPQQPKEQEQGRGQDGSPAEDGPDKMEDSAFAKFNVQVDVARFTDEQYQQLLQSDDWTKEETTYLMDVVRQFDIRWPLVWDQYELQPAATNGSANADDDECKAVVPTAPSRSMEDLKARYYDVSAKLMAVKKPVQYMTQSEFALHELMVSFNYQQEKARKEFALKTLSRSREEAREEESLLLELKRILARSEKLNEERRELYHRLDYPRTETDISAFKSSAGLQTLLQNLMSADKSKKRKSLMVNTTDANSPAGITGPPNGTQDASKRDASAASTGNRRDSTTAVATPVGGGGNKKGAAAAAQILERRKLSAREAAIYGITHHDRLGSGPAFRTEKINKLFSHKSNQQQMRINNTLNELDIPAKLAMPTAATTFQYEQLLTAVNNLLDARKLSDKLDGEIKLEQAKKAEREKLLAPPAPESANNADDAAAAPTDGQASSGSTDKNGDAAPATPANADAGDGEVAQQLEGEAQAGNGEPASEEKSSDAQDKDTRTAPHKRSASVLSSVSDKSSKRQKR